MSKIYTDKKGKVKYYASYQSAWNACIRLNDQEINGSWYFEGDINGWYLHLIEDDDNKVEGN
jgi:hypothetical protein